jgi:NDP-sugar pyrophosphorylase family protein
VLPVAILAGGKGTRIAALAGDRPKALLPVAGQPFLDHQLRWLAHDGAHAVVLCVGYGAADIRAFAGDGARWGLRIAYSDDGELPLGTGGALKRALPLLGESFLTVYGDALLQCPPHRVAAALRPADDGVMTVFENRDRWLRSNVAIAGDHVVAYDKEAVPGKMTYIDYGINAFRARAFDGFENAFDLAEVHRGAIERGTLRALVCTERWYEIGSPEGLAETERFVSTSSPPTIKATRNDVR